MFENSKFGLDEESLQKHYQNVLRKVDLDVFGVDRGRNVSSKEAVLEGPSAIPAEHGNR